MKLLFKQKSLKLGGILILLFPFDQYSNHFQKELDRNIEKMFVGNFFTNTYTTKNYAYREFLKN